MVPSIETLAAASEDDVEPGDEIVESHPECPVVRILGKGETLAQARRPVRVVVGPLASPLRVAVEGA